MTDKEAFIRRLSQRLGREAPEAPAARPPLGAEGLYRPEAGVPGDGALEAARAVLVDRFCARLTAVGGQTAAFDDLSMLHAALRDSLTALAPRAVLAWTPEALRSWALDAVLAPYRRLPPDAPRASLSEADVGITGVDWAVAETGSLVLLADRQRPRAPSLLPPVHIALVRDTDIVPTLGQALRAMRRALAGAWPSAVQFITGPSRSGDIENDLSVGVHGPQAVYAFVLRTEHRSRA